jgi:hypothetical protein
MKKYSTALLLVLMGIITSEIYVAWNQDRQVNNLLKELKKEREATHLLFNQIDSLKTDL